MLNIEYKPHYGFRDLAEEAGIGTLIWSRASYLAANYYHYIVAVFTAVILLFSLIPIAPPPFILLCLAVYAIYFVLRKTLNPTRERQFYQPTNQFIRAQIGFLAITLVIAVLPGAERTLLWFLYLSMILLASKHCSTTRMVFVVVESCAAIVLTRWFRGPSFDSLLQFLLENGDLAVEIVWLCFLSFLLHYLVRNIQARDATIARYIAVNMLTDDIDISDHNAATQWQPLLTALVEYLDGECASTWVCDPKTRQLRLLASVQRSKDNRDAVIFRDNGTPKLVPQDGATLIALVARTGEPHNSQTGSKAHGSIPSCPDCCPLCPDAFAELAVPIKLFVAGEHTTLGVLSVGFDAELFKERLLPKYRDFMQGLVNQAKPMLVYAQRLEEMVALQDVSRQVSHSLDLNQVLDSILAAIVETLGFEFATISLVDQEQRVIRTVRGLNVPAEWQEMAIHSLDSDDIQADIVRTGRTEVIAGWDDRFDRHIWSKFAHRDVIRVFKPIAVVDETTHTERVLGTLEAGYRQDTRSEINPDQLRVLEAFENQAALAIEHAQLLDRVQKKADILASLHRVGNVIASTREPEKVLEEIGDNAKALLGADIVMLYRYNREQRAVEQPMIVGDIWGKYRFNLNLNHETILRRLLGDKSPYYSADAQCDSLLATRPSGDNPPKTPLTFTARQNVKSFAGIPLIAQGETVGVMCVNYRTRHQFDRDERQLHELFAQQAAVAIKNAESNTLERELVVRKERNHLSRELHHSVSQALFGIKLQAQNAINAAPEADRRLSDDLTNILDIAHVASNETSFIIEELRAPVEENRQLTERLSEYIQRLKRWYSADIILECEIQQTLAPRVEQKLFRFAREALNNAVRHSRGHQVTVRCQADAKQLTLAIHDDGAGFDPKRVAPNKLGLTSMRELANEMGGNFTLDTAPGHGTTAHVRILFEQESRK